MDPELPPVPLHKRLHDYFFPGIRNGYKPHFFGVRSLSIVVIGVALLQTAYFVQTKLVFNHTHFLASVLPGVLTGLTNDDRVAANLGTLTNDPALTQAAQLAANDMAANGYFAHVSPDGKNPWYWLKQVGYQYSFSGQNLAVDFTDSQDVEQAWLNSPTHRANIMKAQYTNIGIAVANGQYEGKPVTFVVQYFATPSAEAAAVKTVAATVQAPAIHVSIANLAPKKPSAEPATTSTPLVATTTEASTTSSGTEEVLGASFPPSEPQGAVHGAAAASETFLGRVTTSPHHTVIYLLTILSGFVIILLLISLLMHVRAQCIEVMGGGLMLLILVLLFLLGNAAYTPGVTLPSDTGNSMIESGSVSQ
ncbi:MAG: CAP domain-containing protein [Candidatus Paceibacterota bacterium]